MLSAASALATAWISHRPSYEKNISRVSEWKRMKSIVSSVIDASSAGFMPMNECTTESTKNPRLLLLGLWAKYTAENNRNRERRDLKEQEEEENEAQEW